MKRPAVAMVTILTLAWLAVLPSAEARYNDYAVNKPTNIFKRFWESITG